MGPWPWYRRWDQRWRGAARWDGSFGSTAVLAVLSATLRDRLGTEAVTRGGDGIVTPYPLLDGPLDWESGVKEIKV